MQTQLVYAVAFAPRKHKMEAFEDFSQRSSHKKGNKEMAYDGRLNRDRFWGAEAQQATLCADGIISRPNQHGKSPVG